MASEDGTGGVAVSPYLLRPLRTLDQAVAEIKGRPPCEPLAVRHVIVVDDDPLVALALQETLRVENYRVSTVHDVDQALEIHARDHADALITDLNMPHLTGQDLIRRIHATCSDLPVVVVTGCPPPGGIEDIRTVSSLAPMALLRKPATRDELVNALASVLKR
ncbi:MAG TPA: response regulator [Azospirillum sp.]|nr:response regulator [Azospirillum sp.]